MAVARERRVAPVNCLDQVEDISLFATTGIESTAYHTFTMESKVQIPSTPLPSVPS